MRRRLLVPLDDSPASESALALAELVPSRSVQLLRTEPPSSGGQAGTVSKGELEHWRAGREREMRDDLEEAAKPFLAQGRDVILTTAFDEPADAIVRASQDADLVVMGTHGRDDAQRALIGSVADRVVRHTPSATLLVRGGDTPTSPPPIGRLVVPLDGSRLAETALPAAVDLASDLGVPIHLVRVIDSDPVRDTIRGGLMAAEALKANRTQTEQTAAAYLAHEALELMNRDERATWEVRIGNPAQEIFAALKPGDLLVMTTHARGGITRWLLGSIANQLVRDSPVPVLLVRPDQRHGGAAKPAGNGAADVR
jgi:nucleotide-binding universal stress UspA family protein